MLEGSQLLTFGKSAISLFSDFDAATDSYALKPFVSKASNAYLDYSKAYEREAKNPFTAKLMVCDDLRDSAYLNFRNYIVSWIHSEETDKAEAAHRLMDILGKHGWGAHNFGYKAQTASITKMVNEITDLNMADVQLIDATARFETLKKREEDFEAMQKSSVTRPDDNLPTLLEVRPKLIEALRKLFNIVDYHSAENPADTKLSGYVKALNELITLTMSSARAARTREENKKAGGASSPAA
jgi:hypothetical protein